MPTEAERDSSMRRIQRSLANYALKLDLRDMDRIARLLAMDWKRFRTSLIILGKYPISMFSNFCHVINICPFE